MTLTTFRKNFAQRREFNPAKVADLTELKYFKDNGKWKSGCPFYLDDPFIEVPAMCESKFTAYMLQKMLNKQSKKAP
jgi:hypothetical protein